MKLATVAQRAATCTACPLYESATQTVFGRGPADSRMMLVGEQPGDQEDKAGEPFVGPAGRLLHEVLAEAGLAPGSLYLTNAVKHFKWEPRGKARIHKTPNVGEVTACHPWLEQEIALVHPRVIVALGTTAARAVLGRPVTIKAARGAVLERSGGPPVVVTTHPSAILRARSADERAAMRAGLVADLGLARDAARSG